MKPVGDDMMRDIKKQTDKIQSDILHELKRNYAARIGAPVLAAALKLINKGR
jgi:hypothetical protein